MRRSRFTEEQIIGILNEQGEPGWQPMRGIDCPANGLTTAEVCRKHNLSPATFYVFKARFGGLEVSDARKLKTLDKENRRLKKPLAEAMVDIAVLKDVLGKN